VPETTVCSTSVETIETTEYSTSYPPTVLPTTPSYMTSPHGSSVIPTTPITETQAPTTPATTPVTTPVQPHTSGVTTEVPTYGGGSTSKAPNSTAITSESGVPGYTVPSTLTSVVPAKTSATSPPSIKPTSGGAGIAVAPGLMMGLLALGSYLFV
jgi:hypothetical protein